MQPPSSSGGNGGNGGQPPSHHHDRSSPTPVLPHLSGFLGGPEPAGAGGSHGLGHQQHKRRAASLPASMMARLQQSGTGTVTAPQLLQQQQQQQQQEQQQKQPSEEEEEEEEKGLIFLAKPLRSPLLNPPLAPSDAAWPLAPPLEEGKEGSSPAAAVRGHMNASKHTIIRVGNRKSSRSQKHKHPFPLNKHTNKQTNTPQQTHTHTYKHTITHTHFNKHTNTHTPQQLRDPMTEVALRGKALARLGMVSGTWATVELANAAPGGEGERTRRRLCRLVALDPEHDDPALLLAAGLDGGDDESDEEEEEALVVLVPPPLLFNLSGALGPCRCVFSDVGFSIAACRYVP